MKVGTIVVCLPLQMERVPIENIPHIKWLPVQDEKTPYVIRFYDKESQSVSFEEGIIFITPDGTEVGFPVEYVRELLPPGEIPEEIAEVLSAPELV